MATWEGCFGRCFVKFALQKCKRNLRWSVSSFNIGSFLRIQHLEQRARWFLPDTDQIPCRSSVSQLSGLQKCILCGEIKHETYEIGGTCRGLCNIENELMVFWVEAGPCEVVYFLLRHFINTKWINIGKKTTRRLKVLSSWSSAPVHSPWPSPIRGYAPRRAPMYRLRKGAVETCLESWFCRIQRS